MSTRPSRSCLGPSSSASWTSAVGADCPCSPVGSARKERTHDPSGITPQARSPGQAARRRARRRREGTAGQVPLVAPRRRDGGGGRGRGGGRTRGRGGGGGT